MNGSELILRNAERFGLILATARREFNIPRRLSRSNIGMLMTVRFSELACVFINRSRCVLDLAPT